MEATTRVILEAYSAGVPVVAFPAGGIPEVVENEQTGFLADGFYGRSSRSAHIVSLADESGELGSGREACQERMEPSLYSSGVSQTAFATCSQQALQPRFQRTYDELRNPADVFTD